MMVDISVKCVTLVRFKILGLTVGCRCVVTKSSRFRALRPLFMFVQRAGVCVIGISMPMFANNDIVRVQKHFKAVTKSPLLSNVFTQLYCYNKELQVRTGA